MHRVRQPNEDGDVFFPASLEQQTRITQAIHKGNAYNDQMVSLGISWVNSLIIAAIGFKIVGSTLVDLPATKQWIRASGEDAVRPYLPRFVRNYHHIFPSEAKFWHDYHKLRQMMVQTESIVNTTPAEIINRRFNKKLATLLGTKDQYIIDRFRNLAVYGMQSGHFNFEWNYAAFLAFTSPAINGFILEPALTFLLHKIYALRFILDKPRHALTDIQASKFLAQLKQENANKKAFTHYTNILSRSIMLIQVSYYLYVYLETNLWPSPEIIIFMYANFSKLLIDFGKSQWQDYQQKLLARKLLQATRVMVELLAPSNECKLVKKKTFNDCYIIFRAKETAVLSVAMVNQIVKDTLLRNGITIIEYSKTGFTCKLLDPLTTVQEVKAIKKQIMNKIHRWEEIKILNQQLIKFFSGKYFVQEITTVDDLPTATTIIQHTLGEIGYDRLVKYFPECEIIRAADSIVVIGHTPSVKLISYGMDREVLPAITTESDSQYSGDSEAYSSRNRLRKRKARSILFFDPGTGSSSSADDESENEINVIYSWPSGFYDKSLGTLNAIKPVISNLERLFVLFALPRGFFPSDKAYTKVKAKIEEGRFATSEKGSQGLQFRPEVARDITKPGQPWFNSFLRYKLLGKLGDARFYAKLELTTEGKRLGVFCGGNWSAH